MTADDKATGRARLLFAWLVALTCYRMWVAGGLGVSLYVDEAQYWTWAQDLDWGYFSKPPVIGWLIALSTAVFGDGLVAVKLPALLLYAGTSWLVFLLGRQLFDERIGLRCALAFSLMPFTAIFSLFVSTDAPLLFCWALGVLAFARALALDRWRDWLLMGVAVGLGTMSKYTMLSFGACALLYLLVNRERRRQLGNPRLWTAVGLACLLILPNILWNWANDFPTLHHTADITHVNGHNDKSGNALEFLAGQFGSLGPLIAIAFIATIIVLVRHPRDGKYRARQSPGRPKTALAPSGGGASLTGRAGGTFLLHAFSLPLLGIVLLQAFRSEANGNWAAPAFITACVLAVHWLSRFKARWWIAAVAINAFATVTLYHYQDLFRAIGKPLTAKLDPLKRARGWPQLAQQLRPILAAHPDAIVVAENRTLIAHMRYELRDMRTDFLAWKPQPRAQDHYQLTAPFSTADMSRTVIFITQSNPAPVAERFASQEKLAYLTVQGASFRREMSVVLLKGFRGY
ncbi:MAG: glycosyltransferase family 39 protein [Rhodocyclaceae bacterium]